ncbi:MAG TPA: aminoglycoside phosphotransferase family protein [Caulobacteraceae bacterium]|jgi:aminoglycoside phosphotransferase (APT) family kinase protein
MIMAMAMAADSLDVLPALREVIAGAFPNLAHESFVLAPRGWDSIAVDVGNRLIFKFPRHAAAAERLRKEARLLTAIRPRLSTPVPDMTLTEGPPLFSRHAKLAGEHLTPVAYEALSEGGRERVASQLALFYAELHALDQAELTALGVGRISPWLPTPEIIRRALPRLPEEIRPRAVTALDAYGRLPPDPCGETFGYFDGHGWNLAFDAERERLNGVYDFGDSGLGGLCQEFIYSSLTSFDLTDRIVAAYEGLTGRTLDRGRIDLLTGVHGLSELAELPDDPEKVRAGVERVLRWLRRSRDYDE